MEDFDTYDDACMRAELLGVAPPNREEFEKARAERLEASAQEKDPIEATLLEEQEEAMKGVGGKLDELNTILTSTQQKLNRFKATACGSFSTMFHRGSVDISDSQPTSSTNSRRNTTAGEIKELNITENSTTDEIESNNENEVKPIIPTEKIRQAKLDIQKKMTSHLDKLDSLINKAENAEISMTEQTKDMRKITK